MPFQPMNFANIAPQGNPALRDLVSNLAQGYQAGQMPAQMARQRQHDELANSLLNLKNQEEPQQFQANMQSSNLANALSQLKLQEEPQRFQSDMQNTRLKNAFEQQRNALYGPLMQERMNLYRAQQDKANRTPLTQSENMIQGLENIKSKYGEDSDQYKKATQYMLGGAAAGGRGAQSSDMASKSFITQNQKIVQSIDNTIPIIDKLKAMHSPGQLIGKYLNPNRQTDYEAMTSTVTDSLLGALNLPKTNESINLLEKLVKKGALETDDHYVSRLGELQSDLHSRRLKSSDVISSGKGMGAESSAKGTPVHHDPFGLR